LSRIPAGLGQSGMTIADLLHAHFTVDSWPSTSALVLRVEQDSVDALSWTEVDAVCKGRASYRVSGFIWHGDAHYVAYLVCGKRWHSLNDAVVSEVDVGDLPSEACLVFLEKTLRRKEKAAGVGPRQATNKPPHSIWMRLPGALAQAVGQPRLRLGQVAKSMACQRAIRSGKPRGPRGRSGRQQASPDREQQRSDREQQRSDRKRRRSDRKRQRSDRKQQRSDRKPQRSDRKQQRSDRKQQRSDHKQQRSDRKQQGTTASQAGLESLKQALSDFCVEQVLEDYQVERPENVSRRTWSRRQSKEIERALTRLELCESPDQLVGFAATLLKPANLEAFLYLHVSERDDQDPLCIPLEQVMTTLYPETDHEPLPRQTEEELLVLETELHDRHLQTLFREDFGMEFPSPGKLTSRSRKRTFQGKLKTASPAIIELD